MPDLFRTLVIDAQDATDARMIAAAFGPGGIGMWTTPLSQDGNEPATHYISSGYIPAEFVSLAPCTTWEQDEQGNWVASDIYPGDAATVYAYAQQGGLLLISLATIQGIFSRADCSPQEPFVHMGRMGLQIVQPTEIE
jgi:hypothetical protein